MVQEPMRVLFVCTHNAARSQMAEALLRWIGGDDVAVASAGTAPTRVHPLAVRAMQPYGLDISRAQATPVRDVVGLPFDDVITVCDDAGEACPVFPGDTEHIHWSFPDPSAVTGTDAQRQHAFDVVAVDLIGRLRPWVEIARRVQAGTA